MGSKYAEDVLEDTFEALLHIDELRDLNLPRGWLFRIAGNPAKSVLRKKKMVTDIALDTRMHSSPVNGCPVW